MRPPLLLLALACLFPGCATPTAPADDSLPSGGSPVDVSLTHDYATGEPRTETFTVDGAGRTLRIAAEIRNCAQVEGMRIVVRDPSGATVAEASRASGNVGVAVAGTCASTLRDGVPAPAGMWTVEFSGDGVGQGVVEITG